VFLENADDEHLGNLNNDEDHLLADTEGEPNWQLFLLEVENFLIHKELENGYPSLEQALSTWRKSLQSTDLKKDFLEDNPGVLVKEGYILVINPNIVGRGISIL
jgi:hypothetical protein